ncbi:MAG: glycoside hydrolase family 5 protein [Terracidiphilus sp.]|nr:glycoside hydrolase family 5 protein [Terracidiphilus sp.]
MNFASWVKKPVHSLLPILLLCALASLPTRLTAQGNGYWHTDGSQILDASGRTVRIAGINWFGFETRDQLVHGLWFQDYHRILHTIKESGFNTIRIPFSNQMIENPIVPPLDKVPGGINTDLAHLTSIEIMDHIIQAAGNEGLKVILDNHRSEAGDSNQRSGLWYSARYPESNWIDDWQGLVSRYSSYKDPEGNPIVIGVDLRNEPFLMVNGAPTGSCWTGDTGAGGCPITDRAHNWPAAAQRAAAAVLGVNPNLLIFVEGVDCYSGSCNWQGGNLQGAAAYPVELPFSGHLVYSAHDYGPAVSPQPWFGASTTPELLRDHWTRNWAYLTQQNIAPVWLGEFGTSAADRDVQSQTAGSQGQWFSTLLGFLRSQPRVNWAYWAVNSEDADGLFAPNYEAPARTSLRLEELATVQFPLNASPMAVAQAVPANEEESTQPRPSPGTDAFVFGGGATLTLVALVLSGTVQSSRSKKKRRPAAKHPGQQPSSNA